MEIKVGDIFKIRSNGFMGDHEVKILEIIGEHTAKIIPVRLIDKNDGLLSHMNEELWGIKELKKRIYEK